MTARDDRFLAERFGSDLHALHGLDPHILARAALLSAEETREAVEARIGREARRGLAEELRAAGAGPGRATPQVAVGDAADQILAAAVRIGADLIVMGSRGLANAGNTQVGRVASAVLRAATCAVLAVDDGSERERPTSLAAPS